MLKKTSKFVGETLGHISLAESELNIIVHPDYIEGAASCFRPTHPLREVT